MNNYKSLCEFRSEVPKLRENTDSVDTLSEILSGNQFAFPGLYFFMIVYAVLRI